LRIHKGKGKRGAGKRGGLASIIKKGSCPSRGPEGRAAFFCRGVDLEMGLNTKHEQVGGSADASKTQKHRQVGGC
jgi:hypothetical protein